jgi:tetratricopeptide (TPR) repeat protein
MQFDSNKWIRIVYLQVVIQVMFIFYSLCNANDSMDSLNILDQEVLQKNIAQAAPAIQAAYESRYRYLLKEARYKRVFFAEFVDLASMGVDDAERGSITIQDGMQGTFLMKMELPGDRAPLGKIPQGHGTIWRFRGTVHTRGFSFYGDNSDILRFMLLYNVGLVYMYGKGNVTMPDGKVVNFPDTVLITSKTKNETVPVGMVDSRKLHETSGYNKSMSMLSYVKSAADSNLSRISDYAKRAMAKYRLQNEYQNVQNELSLKWYGALSAGLNAFAQTQGVKLIIDINDTSVIWCNDSSVLFAKNMSKASLMNAFQNRKDLGIEFRDIAIATCDTVLHGYADTPKTDEDYFAWGNFFLRSGAATASISCYNFIERTNAPMEVRSMAEINKGVAELVKHYSARTLSMVEQPYLWNSMHGLIFQICVMDEGGDLFATNRITLQDPNTLEWRRLDLSKQVDMVHLALFNFGDSANAIAMMNAGIIFYSVGRYSEAESLLLKAIARDSSLVLAQVYNAFVLTEQGLANKALLAISSARKQDKRQRFATVLQFLEAKLYCRQHDTIKAPDAFGKALRLCGYGLDSAIIYYERGAYFKQVGKYAIAINDFTIARSLSANNSDALFSRAESYYLSDKYNEALFDLDTLMKQNVKEGSISIAGGPEKPLKTSYGKPRDYVLKAKILLAQKKKKDALSMYCTLLWFYPDSIQGYRYRGDYYVKVRKKKEAIADYSRYLSECDGKCSDADEVRRLLKTLSKK